MAVGAGRGVDLLPGGGVTALALPGGAHRVLARGEGSRVWDTDGREYVDYLLGSGPLIVGHAHPKVVAAVERQARLGSTFYAPTEPLIRLAERIVERVPCAEMVQFCVSGSEATLYALRLARAATGRDQVLKFEGGFHGANDYALMSLYPTGPADYPRAQAGSAGIPPGVADSVLVAPYNDLSTTTTIVEEHAASIAAIIVEPFQRVIAPAPGFLEGLRSLADRFGVVLVFDEVVTGFRWGPASAQGRYGVTPDLASLGKIIGGGYPLAAVAGRREIMALADPSRRSKGETFVYFSGTLNGNPIAAVAGLATLDLLDEPGSYERLFAAGERVRQGLSAVMLGSGLAFQVLGEGPLFQVLLAAGPVTDYRSMQLADGATMKKIASGVFERGFFFTGDKAYISLVHTDEDLDGFVEAFAASLGELGP
jgi:glutamate-1-semialdehyde 2,1-aminomutase